jgi:hypothetical protein
MARVVRCLRRIGRGPGAASTCRQNRFDAQVHRRPDREASPAPSECLLSVARARSAPVASPPRASRASSTSARPFTVGVASLQAFDPPPPSVVSTRRRWDRRDEAWPPVLRSALRSRAGGRFRQPQGCARLPVLCGPFQRAAPMHHVRVNAPNPAGSVLVDNRSRGCRRSRS